MNWDLRASPSWDLTELDRDDFNDLTDANTIRGDQNKGVFSFELGYDIIGDETVKKLYEQKHSTMASSSSGSSNKRGHSSDKHVSCVVDGCISDLSSCRDYYRRHRVCEVHSKKPIVTICGKEQRFCQQCSRFHPLGEFDKVKRSCRKRLDGHNKRRRKPRAESMHLNFGSFLTNHRDTDSKMLQFDHPSAFMTTFGSPLIEPNEEKIKFPFLLTFDSDKVNKAVLDDQEKLFTENLNQLVESKGALSLLSKHTTHTSGASLGNLVQPTSTRLQPSGPLLQHLDPSQLQLE